MTKDDVRAGRTLLGLTTSDIFHAAVALQIAKKEVESSVANARFCGEENLAKMHESDLVSIEGALKKFRLLDAVNMPGFPFDEDGTAGEIDV